jgi:hypothetical protein
VNKNTQNGHKAKAVLFAMNFIENVYASMTSFGKCKLKLKYKM